MTVDTSFEQRRKFNEMMSVRSAFFKLCESSDHGTTGWAFCDGTSAGIESTEMFMMFLTSDSPQDFEEKVFWEIAARDSCPPMWAASAEGESRRSRCAAIMVYS
tara:strand:+ start:870 stop:1181 length:312 start_codon:yes stop_codon:yes gene_type:complete